jgi:hypothetical protein
MLNEVEFDEKTGARTRSLRHSFVASVISLFGIVLRTDNLVSFVQDVHTSLSVALCSLGPNFTLEDPDFGFCRPLLLKLGDQPAGCRDNIICADPSQLQKHCAPCHALTADKFDSWCVGVTLSPKRFAKVNSLAPLNCLRILRNQIFMNEDNSGDREDDLDQDLCLAKLLCLDPSHRISLRELPGSPVNCGASSALCCGPALLENLASVSLDMQSLIAAGLKLLSPLAATLAYGVDALSLLQLKLDLNTYVITSDKSAALQVCSLQNREALLASEKILLDHLFRVVLPQLAVQLSENVGPR